MAYFTIRKIDEDLWRKVKALCALRGITINNFFIDQMEILVKDTSKEKRKKVRIINWIRKIILAIKISSVV